MFYTGFLTACSQAVSKPVWHILLLCVQWKTPDDGQRNCPKHVEFYYKNKFEKLVHLVPFIIRMIVCSFISTINLWIYIKSGTEILHWDLSDGFKNIKSETGLNDIYKTTIDRTERSSIFFKKLTLFKKIIAFYSKNRMKPTNRG